MGVAGGGTNVIILMTIGVVGGIIADMLWYSLGLPGYNVPLQVVMLSVLEMLYR